METSAGVQNNMQVLNKDPGVEGLAVPLNWVLGSRADTHNSGADSVEGRHLVYKSI